MATEEELYWRELDRRYAHQLVPTLREGTVTDAVSVSSYTLLMAGDDEGRPGVPCIADPAPRIGDVVVVALLNTRPQIQFTKTRHPRLETADVTTSQGTTTTSYTDLATAGPSIVLPGLVAGMRVAVTVSARMSVTAVGATQANMSFAVSGAGTLAAADVAAAEQTDSQSNTVSRTTIYTIPNTGDYTFTAKYKVIGATTANFLNRRITIAV